ncbi:MAG: hypothetical protein BGP23_06330 [Lysobacterales bacterium 66-474]|nr:MAG: hypothetical protein ABT18_14925 [Rhodanobacter sp. SCN 66-43]OJY82726.1 MAG: hypothetical protein BGP23_06330 [Xanthomonadales bacterium 66-474]
MRSLFFGREGDATRTRALNLIRLAGPSRRTTCGGARDGGRIRVAAQPLQDFVTDPERFLGAADFVSGRDAFGGAAAVGQNRRAVAVQQLREPIDVEDRAEQGRGYRPASRELTTRGLHQAYSIVQPRAGCIDGIAESDWGDRPSKPGVCPIAGRFRFRDRVTAIRHTLP